MDNLNKVNFHLAKDVILEVKKKMEEMSCSSAMYGIPSGFYDIDKVTSGWQGSDLIIVASQTSMGKSSFILSMIRNIVVDFEIPTIIFSPEMTSNQIVHRLMSAETGIGLTKLRTGRLENHEWEQLSVKVKKLEKSPLYINDSPNLSINQFCLKAKEMVEENHVRIIFIDNIHLMSSNNKGNGDITREHEISIISRRLKGLAKELNVPIIAISQLSRQDFNGYIRRPALSDLRGSGTLEENADIVSFIYRPEFYKIDEWDDDECSPTEGEAEFIIAKHRNGSLSNIRLSFEIEKGKFGNLERSIDIRAEENSLLSKRIPLVNEAFGSNLNNFDDDSDVPF